ncbi:Cytochrome c oxidase assembly protein CtaG [Nymphon striatum]|nr:Cytochrome c oxidase assembly protein CtaG [Nymphon striatum]
MGIYFAYLGFKVWKDGQLRKQICTREKAFWIFYLLSLCSFCRSWHRCNYREGDLTMSEAEFTNETVELSTAQKKSRRAKESCKQLRRTILGLLSCALPWFSGMGGLAYASVPLYQLFCQVTGYGGTTQQVDAQAADGVGIIDRDINIRFDANTASGAGLGVCTTAARSFHQDGREDDYQLRVFFNKIECFCFTDTYIRTRSRYWTMPVVFYVDPEMDQEKAMKALNTITLSYTFYESETSIEDALAGSK